MAFENSRNVQDVLINPVAFALPAAASTSTNSTGIDFGADVHKSADIELELSVPALSTTIVPDTRTVNYIVETSTTSNFAAIDQTILNDQVAGAGGAGVAAYINRVRLPSDCARYVRFKITFGASTTTGAAVSATGTVRF